MAALIRICRMDFLSSKIKQVGTRISQKLEPHIGIESLEQKKVERNRRQALAILRIPFAFLTATTNGASTQSSQVWIFFFKAIGQKPELTST